MGDIGEIYGRYRGDIWEIYGRCMGEAEHAEHLARGEAWGEG